MLNRAKKSAAQSSNKLKVGSLSSTGLIRTGAVDSIANLSKTKPSFSLRLPNKQSDSDDGSSDDEQSNDAKSLSSREKPTNNRDKQKKERRKKRKENQKNINKKRRAGFAEKNVYRKIPKEKKEYDAEKIKLTEVSASSVSAAPASLIEGDADAQLTEQRAEEFKTDKPLSDNNSRSSTPLLTAFPARIKAFAPILGNSWADVEDDEPELPTASKPPKTSAPSSPPKSPDEDHAEDKESLAQLHKGPVVVIEDSLFPAAPAIASASASSLSPTPSLSPPPSFPQTPSPADGEDCNGSDDQWDTEGLFTQRDYENYLQQQALDAQQAALGARRLELQCQQAFLNAQHWNLQQWQTSLAFQQQQLAQIAIEQQKEEDRIKQREFELKIFERRNLAGQDPEAAKHLWSAGMQALGRHRPASAPALGRGKGRGGSPLFFQPGSTRPQPSPPIPFGSSPSPSNSSPSPRQLVSPLLPPHTPRPTGQQPVFFSNQPHPSTTISRPQAAPARPSAPLSLPVTPTSLLAQPHQRPTGSLASSGGIAVSRSSSFSPLKPGGRRRQE